MGAYEPLNTGHTVNPVWFGAVGDGVTDDTLKFQQALNSGDVYIPSGYTFLVTGIAMPSNRLLQGSWQSTLKLKDGTDSPVITSTDTSNWQIDGVRIDGNKANQTGTTTAGIFVKGGSRGTITNCRFENTRIESVLISKNETSTAIPSDIIVASNISVNPSYSGGFRQHYAVTGGRKITIANNIADSDDGFAAYMVDLEPNNSSNPIEDVTVIGNVGKQVGGVAAVSNFGKIIKRITVSGNSALGTGAGRGTHYIIRGVQDISFTGNVASGAGLNGLEVTNSDIVTIAGNSIKDYAIDATAGQKDGIQLTTATHVTIVGNTIQTNVGTAYGIRETASDCSTVVGFNNVDAANGISLASTASRLVYQFWEKDGYPYGDFIFRQAQGSASAMELTWSGTAALLRNNAAATMEFRTTTLRIGPPAVAYPIAGFLSANAIAWNPGNITDGSFDALVTTPAALSTAALGDTVNVSFEDISLPPGMILAAQVTATGELTVTLHNFSGVSQNLGVGSPPTAGHLRIDVWKH